MKPTLITRLLTTALATTALLGLLLLTACAPTPEPTLAPATPTPEAEIVLPLVSSGDAAVKIIAPTHTPQPATEPAARETAPAAASVPNSPLPTPTPEEEEPSPAGARPGPGDPAPDFSLEDDQRGLISLSDYQGRSNVVLVFYRGQV